MIYNVYCDESCHLENDHQPVMAFGASWCRKDQASRLAGELRAIKEHFNARGELKWSKVSNARNHFYIEVVRWFFNEAELHFRGVVVLNKQQLNHGAFNGGDHDLFYYKMQFSLLSKILSPDSVYNIYLDIKDTTSRKRLSKLREVLCCNVYDFTSQMISHIQNIHSHESELMQVADFFTGALTYKHRGLDSNAAKLAVIREIELLSKRSLSVSSSLKEQKFNLFLFQPRAGS